MPLKLYLDDCANSDLLADLLRQVGHQVFRPADANVGLVGADDDVHFAFAAANDLTIITKNPSDFEDLHNIDQAHSGILAVYQDNDPTRDMSDAAIVNAIQNLEAAAQSGGERIQGSSTVSTTGDTEPGGESNVCEKSMHIHDRLQSLLWHVVPVLLVSSTFTALNAIPWYNGRLVDARVDYGIPFTCRIDYVVNWPEAFGDGGRLDNPRAPLIWHTEYDGTGLVANIGVGAYLSLLTWLAAHFLARQSSERGADTKIEKDTQSASSS